MEEKSKPELTCDSSNGKGCRVTTQVWWEFLAVLTLVTSGYLLTLNLLALNDLDRKFSRDYQQRLSLLKEVNESENVSTSALRSSLYSMLEASSIIYSIGFVAGFLLLLGIRKGRKSLIACWMAYSTMSCIWSLVSMMGFYTRVDHTVIISGVVGNLLLFFFGILAVCLSIEDLNEEHNLTKEVTEWKWQKFVNQEYDCNPKGNDDSGKAWRFEQL